MTIWKNSSPPVRFRWNTFWRACTTASATGASSPSCVRREERTSAAIFILNFALEDFPKPDEHLPWRGTLNGQEVERPRERQRTPFLFIVFKTVADPFFRPRFLLQGRVRRSEE